MPDIEYLQITDISKRFGAVEALKGVTFGVRKGEIHTILGENGAGKSTLMKIIKGELKPDTGSICLNRQTIHEFDPLYAQRLGIAMVHQELAIFENLTVAENIFPTSELTNWLGVVDTERMHERARECLAEYHLDIDPGEKVANLPLAQQQIVEILRATSLDRSLIILDEPTSGLKAAETDALIARLKKLRDGGITILFISHRIPEVLRLSDRVTILRDGEYVETLVNENLTEDQLISRMVGRELGELYAERTSHRIDEQKVFLELKGMGRRNSIHDIDLKLYEGEILGVFGLEGSGTAELSKVLFGLERVDTGEAVVRGKAVRRLTPQALIRDRVLYLNDNRKHAGLFLSMSSRDNVAAPVLRRLSTAGLLSGRAMRTHFEELVDRFRIVVAGARAKPRQLSGGNQQKLMLAACLGAEPECIIINEPTRGIDVGAKAEIHQIIADLPAQGASVILFSSELPELISLADRVLVMKDKTVAAELSGSDIDEETIMAAAVGRQEPAASSHG